MNEAIQKILEEFAEYVVYGEENIKQKYQAQTIQKRKAKAEKEELPNIEAMYRKFAKMQNTSFWGYNRTEAYYEQAQYIENVEDDYTEAKQGYREDYYAYNDGSYPRFTLHNFRLYITWRTKVRKGIVEPANAIFPKLYINETLNKMNCKTDEEVIDKLLDFWKSYREIDPMIDYKMRQAIKEFYVLSSLTQPYSEIESRFPCNTDNSQSAIFEIQQGNYHNKLQWISDISGYKIGKSKFLETPYGYMVEQCLEHVLQVAHTELNKIHISLRKLLVKKQTTQGFWSGPLVGYCVYVPEQQEVTKIISPLESYTYKNGEWKRSTYIPNEVYRPFFTYLTKNIECYIRKYVGYRALKKMEKVDILQYCHSYYYTPQQETTLIHIYDMDWDTILKQAIMEYLKTSGVPKDVLKNKKTEAVKQQEPVKIEFHVDSFQDIRQKAEETQKSLIVEEIEEERPIQEIAKPIEPEPPSPVTYDNVYKQFVESLTIGEKEIIQQYITKEHIQSTIDKIAKQTSMMPEMVISQMNDKALETIGDTIIDSNMESIYAEYEAEIKQVL